MKQTSLELIKTKRFVPLFVTQFLGAFNDNLFRTALVTLVTYQTVLIASNQQALFVTIAIGLFILPFFLFSALAGQMADKYNKARLIQIIKLCEIVIMSLAIYGFWINNPYFLLFVLFLTGSQSAFFGPVKYSIIPNHLQKNELIFGNGLIEAGTFIAILLGTVLGGLLVISASAGLYIIAPLVATISILGFIASLCIPKTPAAHSTLKLDFNIIKNNINTIKNAKKHKRIFLAILGISWFWLVGTVFLSQIPIFTKDILNADQTVFTILLTMFSLGIGLGSLFCNKLLKGKITSQYVPVSILLMSVFIFDIANAGHAYYTSEVITTAAEFFNAFSGWRIAIDLFLLSFSGGVYIVPLYALMQTLSSEQKRSRTIAANNVINAFFMVIASAITSLLLAVGMSIPSLFTLLAIANTLVALYICKILPQTLIKSLLAKLLRLCFRVEVRGLVHYPKQHRPTIIIANHSSFLDALLLAVFLPEAVTFAINTFMAQKPLLKPFLSLTKVFTIDPANPMGMKSLINEVQHGQKLVIFPEGRLTMTGSLMKVYAGPGMIADKTGADILPIYIDGAGRSMFSRSGIKLKRSWFPKITLTLRPVTKIVIGKDIKGKKRRDKAGEQLYSIMSNMMFESGDMAHTLFESLIAAKHRFGSKHLVINDTSRKPMHYSHVISRSFILGKALSKQTKAGEHVGLLLPNMMGTVLTFFGLQAYARIPTMLNFSTGAKNVSLACITAQIKTVYTSRLFIEKAELEDMVTAIQNVGARVIYLEDIRPRLSLWDKLQGLLGNIWAKRYYHWCNRAHAHLIDDNTPAVILFTSGSEGAPKGVVLSHKNIQANRLQLASRLDLNPTDKVFNALPMFHSFGLTGGTILPILLGLQTFFYPSPLHYHIVPELVYDTNATIMFGTDTFLAGYSRHSHPYDFYNLRYVFAGAEKLKEETRRLWLEKFGVRIFEGYGVTEAAPVIATNTPMHNKVNTVGKALPGITTRIEAVPGIHEGGRLFVKGPNVMLGYLLNDMPGVLMPPKKGWYDTGDIVTIDDEGYISIKGRAKRFAKLGGEMISLTAVEQYVSELWPNAQHAVIAISDERKGEQLLLVTTQPKATTSDILAFVQQHGLAALSVPKYIKIVPEIPILGTGKIDYVSIQRQYGS